MDIDISGYGMFPSVRKALQEAGIVFDANKIVAPDDTQVRHEGQITAHLFPNGLEIQLDGESEVNVAGRKNCASLFPDIRFKYAVGQTVRIACGGPYQGNLFVIGDDGRIDVQSVPTYYYAKHDRWYFEDEVELAEGEASDG